jgi:hypothetical protein
MKEKGEQAKSEGRTRRGTRDDRNRDQNTTPTFFKNYDTPTLAS